MWAILGLSALMGAISLAASIAPFYISFDTTKFSQLAVGVVLGSAFLIVIPEGMVTMASASAGYPLLAGYVAMLVLDVLLKSHTETRPEEIDVGAARVVPPETEDKNRRVNTTSIGMIVHAAADGIALGATAGGDSLTLQLVVFLSIVVHKAPTAFSLTSILLADNVPRAIAWRDALIFSAAGPVAAVLVALFLGSRSEESLKWWAGIALTFSGGTFAFVAVHMQQRAIKHGLDKYAYARVFGGMAVPFLATLLPDID